jgi:hypothetical protein
MKWGALAALLATLAGLASLASARAPAPRPRTSDPEVERLLEIGYGKDLKRWGDLPIRFVIRHTINDSDGRMVFAAREAIFEQDGWVALTPSRSVWFSRQAGKLVPAAYLEGEEKCRLQFDRPVLRLADLPRARLLRLRCGTLKLGADPKR